MPHYYFYLTDDHGSVPDEDGMEFAGLSAAKHAALAGLQELLCDLTEFDDEIGEGHVDIIDEQGLVCASIAFDEVHLGHANAARAHQTAQILRPLFGRS